MNAPSVGNSDTAILAKYYALHFSQDTSLLEMQIFLKIFIGSAYRVGITVTTFIYDDRVKTVQLAEHRAGTDLGDDF